MQRNVTFYGWVKTYIHYLTCPLFTGAVIITTCVGHTDVAWVPFRQQGKSGTLTVMSDIGLK